jgi:hypothetical protein
MAHEEFNALCALQEIAAIWSGQQEDGNGRNVLKSQIYRHWPSLAEALNSGVKAVEVIEPIQAEAVVVVSKDSWRWLSG